MPAPVPWPSATLGYVQRNWLISLLLAIVALVIAWFLVQVLFSAVWFLLRLAVVLVVAVIVYVAVAGWLARRRRDRQRG